MNIKKTYILPAILMVTLAACGGGGGSDDGGGNNSGTDNPSPGDSTGGNTGSVSALFAPSTNPRYQLVGPGNQGFGGLSNQEQLSDGAVVKINSKALDGNDRAVKDIKGDANYALGRWHAGTVTDSGGAMTTLTGAQGSDYHYMLVNSLSAFPASGNFDCDAGSFTTPSRASTSSGASDPVSGSVTGFASVSFDASGAHTSGTLSVTGTDSTTVSLDANPGSPTSTVITGSYLSSGTGAAVQIGDGGIGNITVVGTYAAKINNSKYIGAYRFLCQPKVSAPAL